MVIVDASVLVPLLVGEDDSPAARAMADDEPEIMAPDLILAMIKRGDGRASFWCKAPPGSQAILVEADPARFFVLPYVGHKGWVGMRIDDGPDWPRSNSWCGAAMG
jgi:hypothetical protein